MKKRNYIYKEFVSDLKEIFRNGLKSVVLYGSSQTKNFIEGKSNYNILVVVKKLEFDELKRCTNYTKKWNRRRIVTPLILTGNDLKTSTDVFPMEFLDIKEQHSILYGRDPFKKLRIEPDNLRLECEFELKSKLIKLRENYIEIGKNRRMLEALLSTSLSTFFAIFRNILRLRKIDIPESNVDLIEKVSEIYKLNLKSFKDVFQLKQRKKRLKQADLISLFKSYLIQLERLAKIVDEMEF